MCGRLFRDGSILDDTRLILGGTTAQLGSNMADRYNVAPTTTLEVVVAGEAGRALVPMRWGFSAPWKPGLALINAMVETILTKRTWSLAMRAGRRCIVPVTGFYEWEEVQAKPRKIRPWAIAPAAGGVLAMPGLWQTFPNPKTGEPTPCFTIVTTEPTAIVAELHDRQPALLEKRDYAAWLGEEEATPEDLLERVRPTPPGYFEAWRVGSTVNKSGQGDSDPSLIWPVAD